jgi:hypothetical protein
MLSGPYRRSILNVVQPSVVAPHQHLLSTRKGECPLWPNVVAPFCTYPTKIKMRTYWIDFEENFSTSENSTWGQCYKTFLSVIC